MKFVLLTFSLFFASIISHGAEPTRITLTNGDRPHMVPEGQMWKIEHLDPYESEKGVGTADLSVQGSAQVGEHRELALDGTFDITLSGRQPMPLWILPGSKVGVGDSRGTVVFEVLPSTATTTGLPDEVTLYVQRRDLCEHFRGEPSDGQQPLQIERREFLRQSIEIYCAGTDRQLAALKLRYGADTAALSILESYEASGEGN